MGSNSSKSQKVEDTGEVNTNFYFGDGFTTDIRIIFDVMVIIAAIYIINKAIQWQHARVQRRIRRDMSCGQLQEILLAPRRTVEANV